MNALKSNTFGVNCGNYKTSFFEYNKRVLDVDHNFWYSFFGELIRIHLKSIQSLYRKVKPETEVVNFTTSFFSDIFIHAFKKL